MRKLIDYVSWIFVIITVMVLITTMLASYQFIFLKYFNSYKLIQFCIFCTMTIWGLKSIKQKNSFNVVYTLLCLLIAVGSAFFMYVGVV